MTSVPPPPTVPPATPPPPGGGSYTPPPPPPPGGGPGYTPPAGGAGGDRTIMLILSYAWLACLVPLLTKKEDPEVQWHAKNGLVLSVAVTAVFIFFSILTYFFPTFMTCIGSFFWCALAVAYLVVAIVGMVKAVNGQRLRVPGLTDQAEKLNL